ncbi:MAG TPA: MlaD family protein [Flavisolibacter sp.]|jgi:phospholipid/cholesterol/gamma-HCH transport system substrate-binding protein
MSKERGSNWKLGLFVIIGLVLFAGTIYFVGKQKNLFGSTFHLVAHFKSAGGLKEGNNVRFSGINIGSVNSILLTDTIVIVELMIRKEVQAFIKTDATATIGSDGLMGDKVLTINPGTTATAFVKDGDIILTKKPIDMDDIMASLKTNVDNAAIISTQLAEFTYKMNNSNGLLSKVMDDEAFAKSLETTLTNLQGSSVQFSKFALMMNNDKGALATLMTDQGLANNIKQTVANLQASSDEFMLFSAKMNNDKGALSRLVTDEKIGNAVDMTLTNLQGATQKLDENMQALQSNFLLRGFFKKKEKAEAKLKADAKKAADAKIKADKKLSVDADKDPKLLLVKDTTRS